MTTSYNYRAPTPVHQILVCYHEQRIIGHIVERNGQHHARSWPGEILIGFYASHEDAVIAIVEAAGLFAQDDEADKQITIKPYQVPDKLDELVYQMLEVINICRVDEFSTLHQFLKDRGFHDDDLGPLIERAEQRYAAIP